jgi:hypothetical protein
MLSTVVPGPTGSSAERAMTACAAAMDTTRWWEGSGQDTLQGGVG